MSSNKPSNIQRPGISKQGSSYHNQQKLVNLQELGLLSERPTNKRSKQPSLTESLSLSSIVPHTLIDAIVRHLMAGIVHSVDLVSLWLSRTVVASKYPPTSRNDQVVSVHLQAFLYSERLEYHCNIDVGPFSTSRVGRPSRREQDKRSKNLAQPHRGPAASSYPKSSLQ